jgi:hypothetical protein
MKKQNRLLKTTLCLGAIVVSLVGAVHAEPEDKIIAGDSVTVAGGTVCTWARVNGAGKVIWVGLTIPVSLAENPPAPGSGPAGAFAVLNYPAVAQETTYFNHAEIQFNEHGHPTNPVYAQTNRYSAAHFDIHFYSIPVADVFTIPGGLFFTPVPAERLPDGWAQPEPRSVPQMGRHAGPISEFTATDPWLATMIAGFLPNGSSMHFIEPMITRDLLLLRQNFTLPVPTPAVLGRATQYPTECVVHYDKDADACHIVYKGFEPIE